MIKQTKVWLVLSITLSLALASACGGGKDPTITNNKGQLTAPAGSGPVQRSDRHGFRRYQL